ncbi:DNA/RNA helicase domain-containing protein [Modestobacter sp. SYSU DS0290]
MNRHRWQGSGQDFIDSTRRGTIDRLVEQIAPPTSFARAHAHRRGETGSWTNSLPRLADVLRRAQLDDVHVVLEYNPYQSGNARVDAVLAGWSPSGQATFVVVELKQWSAGERDPETGRIRRTGASYETPEGLKDPYDQARDYAAFIRNYTEGMHDEDRVAIRPVAYLHNATEDSVRTLLSGDWQRERHVFTGDLAGETRFVDTLHSWFARGADHAAVGRVLLEARYHQAPALLEAASEILTDPANYPMTVEQGEVHAKVLHAVQQALSDSADRDRAIIVVNGGPGTGKTWIAMHLLGSNAQARRQVSYATNSSSLRQALSRRARRGLRMLDRPVDALITSARTYWNEQRWGRRERLDVLLVDEAHRIAEYTVRTGHANRRDIQDDLETRGITQLYELARSASVLVLFIDEDQAITPKDDCSIDRIRAVAERVGASFEEFHLTEQHRSGGSEAYEAWVDALVAGAPRPWRDEENFEVRVVDSPEELERVTFDADGAGADSGARLLAGFCWAWQPWPKGARSIIEVPLDIKIGQWEKRWNLHSGVDGYPADISWASDPAGAEQVGSVFTAQGFEFGRCGVIIGPDFRWDPAADEWVVDVSQTKYPKLLAAARRADDPNAVADAEDLVRNHYRVLLTRAMASTTIYATDEATRAKLAELVNPRER